MVSEPCLRLANINIIEQELDQKLSKFAQHLFFDRIVEQSFVLRETEPNMKDFYPPGGRYWLDIAKLFLWWICYYESYERIHTLYGVPKSTWSECVQWILRRVKVN